MKGGIHYTSNKIVEKVEGLYHIVPINSFRKTKNVNFELMPLGIGCQVIDIVTHEIGARSPGCIDGKGNYWYKHSGQEDNLITLHGNREVELYTKEHGKIEKFEISHDRIKLNGEVIYEGSAMLGWPIDVYHRNCSPEGSVSINGVIRFNNFDLDTEFNIYDLDIDIGESKVLRIGKLDQS